MTDKGGLVPDARFRTRWGAPSGSTELRPAIFVPPDSLSARRLAELWSEVILTAKQDAVISALRIIEPELEQVIFLPNVDYGIRPISALSGIVAVRSDSQRPVPLGSMGDGMRRLLALSTALTSAAGGVLLIDEIDTGLHYTTMAEMWRIVVETAVTHNFQVLATAHSLDCVNGLGVLCQREPHLVNEVVVNKIESGLAQSVPFVGEKFVRAFEGGIELR